MTNAEQALSYDTVKHLDQWLDREFSTWEWSAAVAIRQALMELVAYDADWLDRGWWKAFDYLRRHGDI